MTDITMCQGEDCPIKNDCLRYRAIPCDYQQSYFLNAPYDAEIDSCDEFIQVQAVDKTLPGDDLIN